MNDEDLKFCTNIKTEYYKRNIKMLYNWSNIPEHDILNYLDVLGLIAYRPAIKWLLSNKARLDAEININISELLNNMRGTAEYTRILDCLKVALIVCNKNQAIKILSSIVLYSSNPKEDISNLNTF